MDVPPPNNVPAPPENVHVDAIWTFYYMLAQYITSHYVHHICLGQRLPTLRTITIFITNLALDILSEYFDTWAQSLIFRACYLVLPTLCEYLEWNYNMIENTCAFMPRRIFYPLVRFANMLDNVIYALHQIFAPYQNALVIMAVVYLALHGRHLPDR